MLLSADSFNRTDSTTSLGSTDGAGSLDPLTWTQDRGTWGIENNQAYTSAALSVSKATVDLALADVDLTVEVTVSNAQGLTFRYVDLNNYWYFTVEGTSTTLNRVSAGVDTLISTASSGGLGPLRVIAVGAAIGCFRNGLLRHRTVDSAHQTATKHGLFNKAFTTNRLDNWSASTPVAGNFLPFFT